MSYIPPSSPPLHHPVPQHPIQFQQGSQRYAGMPQHNYQPQDNDFNQYGAPVMPQANMRGSNFQQRAPQGPQILRNTAGPQVPVPGPANPNTFGAEPFNQFLHDPAAQIGIEVGRNAINYGQEYLNRSVEAYVSVSALRSYFQVSNSYVMKKLMLVIFPWRHKAWSRKLQRSDTNGAEIHSLPRDDVNAPDMYIPLTAITTWLVLYSVTRGLKGEFQPELLGLLSTKAFALIAIEILFLKLFTYLLAASSKLLDFVAYAGYKFVPVTLVTALTAFTSSKAIKWNVFAYLAAAISFFMLRTLRYDLLQDVAATSSSTITQANKQRKIHFLFVYAVVCQTFLMWLLL